MGLFDKLFGKKEVTESVESLQTPSSFTYRVYDVFPLKNSTDIVVVGKVDGVLRQGDALYLTNYGQDDSPIILTMASSLEVDGSPVNFAKDTIVAIRLENGQSMGIKPTTIGFSQDKTSLDLDRTYTNAIGDVWIGQRGFHLSSEDFTALSLTDCAEVWRLANWRFSQQQHSSEEIAEHQGRLNLLGQAMVDKILGSSELYVLMDKKTNQPHLFSKTIVRDGGYECLPPDLLLVTKPKKLLTEAQFSSERYELKVLTAADDGIKNFLGQAFYQLGACGVTVNSDKLAINASMLVEEPDFSEVPDIQVPILNPDVRRWLLLLAQMDKQESDTDQELITGLYQKFLFLALKGARFLRPMKGELSIRDKDENRRGVLEKDSVILLSQMEGKDGRPAIPYFTDWQALRQSCGEDWSGLIMTIEESIEKYDVVLNSGISEAIYISKDLWKEISRLND